jgi:hypothetical protein
VTFDPKKPTSHPVAPGEAVVLRHGTAAAGFRVPWARACDGGAAAVALCDDGNPHGVVRLTVTHLAGAPAPSNQPPAGAAFWVRIGSGLDSDAAFAGWRRDFAAAPATAVVVPERIRLLAAGVDGALFIGAEAPFAAPATLTPPPPRHLLAVDGLDLGRRLIENLEPIRSVRERLALVTPVAVAADGAAWEAENCRVTLPMIWAQEAAASGGEFVWMPVPAGDRGGSSTANATWLLKVAAAGTYYLWGRVRSPTPENDSFYLQAAATGGEVLQKTGWMTGVHTNWTWIPFVPEGSKKPEPLRLPQGAVTLQLLVREGGTMMDRLFLTPSPTNRPPDLYH